MSAVEAAEAEAAEAATVSAVETVGVVGCGVMGAGLAEACARAGLEVRVAVSRQASAQAGRGRIEASLNRAVRKGRIEEAERDAILDRVILTTELGDLAGCTLVFENVTEDLALKLRILARLDDVLGAGAVIATNTSSLRVGRLARATTRPGHIVGTHFFNPVPVMPLVEVIGTPVTEPEAHARTESFLTGQLGKQVVRSADRAGFVVNALLVPFLLDAIRMLERGDADPADIDRGMVLGCGHPMGPLALADFTGLDTLAAVARGLHEDSGDARFEPPKLLLRMVEEGKLGTKSGGGFLAAV